LLLPTVSPAEKTLQVGQLVGKTPLSPAHRRLLSQLLSGKSEKEIADTLGLSRTTTHKYITAYLSQLRCYQPHRAGDALDGRAGTEDPFYLAG
jgi:DNA-binding NarL/FixJ family response regulator